MQLKATTKLMMVGTREETIAAANEKPKDLEEVVDDFDIGDEEVQTENRCVARPSGHPNHFLPPCPNLLVLLTSVYVKSYLKRKIQDG